mgnify:CR=1 FL=1
MNDSRLAQRAILEDKQINFLQKEKLNLFITGKVKYIVLIEDFKMIPIYEYEKEMAELDILIDARIEFIKSQYFISPRIFNY